MPTAADENNSLAWVVCRAEVRGWGVGVGMGVGVGVVGLLAGGHGVVIGRAG
ncbi:MAG: hypothetical protein ACK5ZI_11810 [bacterium]